MPRTTLLAAVAALVALAFCVVPLQARRTAAPPEISGTWHFIDDHNPHRFDSMGDPPFGESLTMRTEGETMVFEWTSRGATTTHRYKLDGTEETTTHGRMTSKHSGRWDGEEFVIHETTEGPGTFGPKTKTIITRTLRFDGDTFVVENEVTKPMPSTTNFLYRKTGGKPAKPGEAPSDPTKPAKPSKPKKPAEPDAPAEPTKETGSKGGSIDDLGWLSGAWIASMGNATIDERWTPAAGGAMLATSRSVSGKKMTEFEFLRIVERDGTLIYVAQPEGGEATEFPLAKIEGRSVVFENPAHDFPQRITYRLGDDGTLTAEISDIQATKAKKFTFRREAAR